MPATKPEEACLICAKPLRYSLTAYEAACSGCGRVFTTNTECEDGHFICDSCHSQASLPVIYHICSTTSSRDPYAIANEIMQHPTVHMHGPENHVLIGSSLLAAYKNSGGDIDLAAALLEMRQRGSQLPGGICGFWGSCGAGVSAGMFMSIITGSTPLSVESWSLSNLMTSEALKSISEHGGPRCCKRNGFLAIIAATSFASKHQGIQMQLPKAPECTFSPRNKECIEHRCPFYTD